MRKQAGLEGEGALPYRYVLRFADEGERDRAQEAFLAGGVHTAVPIQRFELLHRYLGLDPADFSIAERMADTTLSLPIFPAMTEDEVERTAAILRSLG